MQIEPLLQRLLAAVERISPPPLDMPNFQNADAFLWQRNPMFLKPILNVNRVDISLLVGIDQARDCLLENTMHFIDGLPANNALLWGARGMGKSSLVKSVHGAMVAAGQHLKLIEIQHDDIGSLPALLNILRGRPEKFILFCDDLSFDYDDNAYKALKVILDGGIEGRPENVLFYATSNRRHLTSRDMIENERSTAINPSEAVEEKVSLSDRFGLWLGFHSCDQPDYLAMIKGYVNKFGIDISDEDMRAEAIEWQQTRGARSGRVAWQYIIDLAGRKGNKLN